MWRKFYCLIMSNIILQHLNQLLRQNPFQLFAIPQNFIINLDHLTKSYLQLQKKYHPDNFVNELPEIKSLALKVSSHINNAYNSLKNPLQRSLTLLDLQGITLNLSSDTQLPQTFLYEQIETHEEIENAVEKQDISLLEQIERSLQNKELILIKKLEEAFNKCELELVIKLTKQLAFYNRLLETVTETINNLN